MDFIVADRQTDRQTQCSKLIKAFVNLYGVQKVRDRKNLVRQSYIHQGNFSVDMV